MKEAWLLCLSVLEKDAWLSMYLCYLEKDACHLSVKATTLFTFTLTFMAFGYLDMDPE